MKKVVIILSCIVVVFIVLMVVGYKNMISENDALKISYEYANVEENEVTIKFISTDYSSFEYEIKFYDDYYEYEIDVNFFNGSINNYEKDALNINNVDTKEGENYLVLEENNTSTYIGVDKAKEIVLNHANLSNSDVTWYKVKLDIENTIAVYEIEFYYNNNEYEYEVNAITGEIISYEKDRY